MQTTKPTPNILNMGFWRAPSWLKYVIWINCCAFLFIFFFLVHLPKVYKSIFTSPSSVADDCKSDPENKAPLKAAKLSQSRKKVMKHNVTSKLHMNDKVTLWSIAYAAVQVFDSMHLLEYLLMFISTPASLQFADCWAMVWSLWRIQLLWPLQLHHWLFWRCARGPHEETCTGLTSVVVFVSLLSMVLNDH